MGSKLELPHWFKTTLAILPGLLMIAVSLSFDQSGVSILLTMLFYTFLTLFGYFFTKTPHTWLLPAASLLFVMTISGNWMYVLAKLLNINAIAGRISTFEPMINIAGMLVGLLAFAIGLARFVRSLKRQNWLLWIVCAMMILTPPLGFLFSTSTSQPLGWSDLAAITAFSMLMLGLPLLTVYISQRIAYSHGIAATLVVSSSAFFLWEFLLDINYGIWGHPWALVADAQLAFWLLVITPLWVMIVKSPRFKMVGVLSIPLIGLVLALVLSTLIRSDASFLDSLINLSVWLPSRRMFVGANSQPGQFWFLLFNKVWLALPMYLTLVLSVIINYEIGRNTTNPQLSVESSLSQPSLDDKRVLFIQPLSIQPSQKS